MFWVFVILAVVIIVGLSWLAGTFLNKRAANSRGGHGMSRQDKIRAASLSGAFPIRKEDQP